MGRHKSHILDDLTVEDYLKLRSEGLSNEMIAEKYYVGKSSLYNWIKEQKEVGTIPKMDQYKNLVLDDLTLNEYLKLRKKGLSNRKIAEKYHVGLSSLDKWIKKQKESGDLPNGKMACNKPSNIGKKINLDVYKELRLEGKSHQYIADAVGISKTSLWNWRQKKLG